MCDTQHNTDLRHVAEVMRQGWRKTDNVVLTDWDDFHAECVLVVVGIAARVMRDKFLGCVCPAKTLSDSMFVTQTPLINQKKFTNTLGLKPH